MVLCIPFFFFFFLYSGASLYLGVFTLLIIFVARHSYMDTLSTFPIDFDNFCTKYYAPQPKDREGGHIVLGADLVGVGIGNMFW